MKNKIILVLISTILTVSMIGCGSKDKQTTSSTENKATVSADQDVEIKKDYGEDIFLMSKSYLKAFNREVSLESESYLVGTVTADKDNLSKIEAFEKTRDERTEICFVDTTGVTDLKVGDVVNIGVIKDENDKNKKEFRYKIEPISMTEYKKTVAERTGDTRDKSTKDENVYLKDEKNNLHFAPELSMEMCNDRISLFPTTIMDSNYISNVRGTYDGEVVLNYINNPEEMLIATKVNDKYEYFFVNVAELKRLGIIKKDYKIGDKVKVTIGTGQNKETVVYIK